MSPKEKPWIFEQGIFLKTGERFNINGERWEIENERKSGAELNFYHCGEHECVPDHSWGPAVRDHFLIHFVVSGKGMFKCGNKTYELGAGDGFLICPDTVVHYQADSIEPWHYYWVGFNGVNARKFLHEARLTTNSPIFHSEDTGFFVDLINRMAEIGEYSLQQELYRTGLLYLYLSKLLQIAEDSRQQGTYKHSIVEDYIRSAVHYVDMHSHCDVGVNDLAAHIGISRKYLYTIFVNYLGQSPQEFILRLKMNKACTLLTGQQLTVSEVSNSVGYRDQFNFSKQFKKIIGISPSEYRKQEKAQ